MRIVWMGHSSIIIGLASHVLIIKFRGGTKIINTLLYVTIAYTSVYSFCGEA
jgi:hypothetical protein